MTPERLKEIRENEAVCSDFPRAAHDLFQELLAEIDRLKARARLDWLRLVDSQAMVEGGRTLCGICGWEMERHDGAWRPTCECLGAPNG